MVTEEQWRYNIEARVNSLERCIASVVTSPPLRRCNATLRLSTEWPAIYCEVEQGHSSVVLHSAGLRGVKVYWSFTEGENDGA